jgi:hypothetical protein
LSATKPDGLVAAFDTQLDQVGCQLTIGTSDEKSHASTVTGSETAERNDWPVGSLRLQQCFDRIGCLQCFRNCDVHVQVPIGS